MKITCSKTFLDCIEHQFSLLKRGIVDNLHNFPYVTLTILLISLLVITQTADGSVLGDDFQQYQEVTPSQIKQGSLLFKVGGAASYYLAPTVNTQVEFHISGIIARVMVKQTFTNPDDTWVEGVYVFPLPENAAVDHMRMVIGERVIDGEIKEKAEAKKIYAKAKREGKKASLIEQERPNLFTNSVANIGPHETITVEIEYQQTLKYEQKNGAGQFELRFPTTFTPRYIPGKTITQTQSEEIETFSGSGWAFNTDQVPDASRITPPFRDYGDWSNPISIEVNLDAGFPINNIDSPYHDIQTTYNSTGNVFIELAHRAIPANRDFNLVWNIDSGYVPKAALFNEIIDGDYYHLIMVMPPDDSVGGTQHLAREVIYVIDTSGSMSGASITQAKAGLKMALARLRHFDTFNIIEFDSNYSTLFSKTQPANPENKQRALDFIDDLVANGGTEMIPALATAFEEKEKESVVQQVIFLTDGSVGNEQDLFSLIHRELGNRRLFMVGIGSAPNSHFMTKAAEFGRGTYTFIGSVNEVQEKMGALFRKLETPVLTNLKIDWPGDADLEVWPKRLPDLYVGEPLIISAKTESFDGNITITGQRSNTEWKVSLPLRGGQDNAGVGALWARNKIKSLMDSLVEGADKPTVRSNIIKVALQHHLVSKYTSLVAVDKTPSRVVDELLKRRNIANNLPKGSHFGRVTSAFAKTSTDAPVKLVIGLILLSFSLIAVWRRRCNEAW